MVPCSADATRPREVHPSKAVHTVAVAGRRVDRREEKLGALVEDFCLRSSGGKLARSAEERAVGEERGDRRGRSGGFVIPDVSGHV